MKSRFGFGYCNELGELGNVRLGSLLNQPIIPDGAITTKDGQMIVLTTGDEYILTVNGFVPLNALRSLSGDVVKTKNLDFIII